MRLYARLSISSLNTIVRTTWNSRIHPFNDKTNAYGQTTGKAPTRLSTVAAVITGDLRHLSVRTYKYRYVEVAYSHRVQSAFIGNVFDLMV